MAASISAYSQSWTPAQYTQAKGLIADSVLRVPRIDTISKGGNKDSLGMLLYRPADDKYYGKKNGRWAPLAEGGDLSSYVPITRLISTISPLSGGGNLAIDRTLSIANAQADGENKGAATFRSDHFDDDGQGAISLDVPNGPFLPKTDTAGMLSGYIRLSQRGTANGVATLDATGKVPLSQVPESLLGAVVYQGTYNAATNTPALPAAASGNKGWYYVVSVAGTQQSLTLNPGDWVISNGSSWGKVDNNNAVTSVFGRTGAVTAQSGDYNTSQVTESTNLYYTNGRARAAVGASSPLNYNSTTGIFGLSTVPVANGGTGLTGLGTANQLLRVNSGATALEYFTPTYISGNQTITLSGDVTGSGTTAITTALSNVGTAGTYTKVTTDSKGRVTSGTTLAAADIPTLTSAKISDFTTAARSALSATAPLAYNSGTGALSIPAAGSGVSGYVSNSAQTISGAKAFENNVSVGTSSTGATEKFSVSDGVGGLRLYVNPSNSNNRIDVGAVNSSFVPVKLALVADPLEITGSMTVGVSGTNTSLQVNGSQGGSYFVTNSNITLNNTRYILRVTTGGITITLPPNSGIEGRIYKIRNETATPCTISSVLIDGVSTTTLPGNTYWEIFSDGVNWRLLSRSN